MQRIDICTLGLCEKFMVGEVQNQSFLAICACCWELGNLVLDLALTQLSHIESQTKFSLTYRVRELDSNFVFCGNNSQAHSDTPKQIQCVL